MHIERDVYIYIYIYTYIYICISINSIFTHTLLGAEPLLFKHSGVHKGGFSKGDLAVYVLSYYYCETPLCELPFVNTVYEIIILYCLRNITKYYIILILLTKYILL